MQRHGALRSVQYEKFAPNQPQKRHLVGHLKVREERNVPGPLDCAEQQSSSKFADIVDTHNVVGLHTLGVPRRRIRFGPQQQGDKAGQVGMRAIESVAVGQCHLAWESMLAWGDPPPLYRWAPTLPSHSHLEAFLEPAVLALVPVVLVDRTVPVAPARVRQIPPDAPLEEGFAALARELTIVFPTGLVATHHALYMLLLTAVLVRTGRRYGLWRTAGQIGAAVSPGRNGQRRHVLRTRTHTPQHRTTSLLGHELTLTRTTTPEA
ncbi:hypothetical protein X975_26569, partial [Stegodyphus mimosarum]